MRQLGAVRRSDVGPPRGRGKAGLRRTFFRLLQDSSSERNAGLAGDRPGDQLRLVEAALPPAASRERHGNHRGGALEVGRGHPGAARPAAEDGRDATSASELQRVQAQTDIVQVRRFRPGSAEVPRAAPARTAETGLDPGRVGKRAARTEGLTDPGKAVETIPTKGPFEGQRERLSAKEADRGKQESAQTVERLRSESADQGVDQVGAGWMVGSGAATTGRWSPTVSHRRHLAQRSVHSEERKSQALHT